MLLCVIRCVCIKTISFAYIICVVWNDINIVCWRRNLINVCGEDCDTQLMRMYQFEFCKLTLEIISKCK